MKDWEREDRFAAKRGNVALRRVGNLLYVGGHGPEDQLTGEALYQGRIGTDLSVDTGYEAARECARIITGALKDYLGSLDRVESFVRVFALVNCGEGFHEIDHVMDGFSDFIMEVFEERGYHARTAMGTHNLPNGNIPCEFEIIVRIR